MSRLKKLIVEASITILVCEVRSSDNIFPFCWGSGWSSILTQDLWKYLIFLVPYVNDIILAKRDISVLKQTKHFLLENFEMKDFGEASFIFWMGNHSDGRIGALLIALVESQTSRRNTDEALPRWGFSSLAHIRFCLDFCISGAFNQVRGENRWLKNRSVLSKLVDFGVSNWASFSFTWLFHNWMRKIRRVEQESDNSEIPSVNGKIVGV